MVTPGKFKDKIAIKFFDVESSDLMEEVEVGTSLIEDFDLTADCSKLVVVDSWRKLAVYDVAKKKLLGSAENLGISHARFTHGGSEIVVMRNSESTVEV